MRKYIPFLGVLIAGAGMVFASQVAKAQSIGDTISTRGMCSTQEMVEDHIRTAEKEGGYDTINREFQEAIGQNECMLLPSPVQGAIQAVGYQSRPFLDSDKDVVVLTAVKVFGVWTIHLTLKGKGGQS